MLVGADDQRNTTPRGSCRATAGMLTRLSTRGNAVSGTTYSPGVAVPATAPASWIKLPSTPPATGVVSAAALSTPALAAALSAPGLVAPFLAAGFVAAFAVSRLAGVAGAAFFLAESPPRSCSTADGLPVPAAVSP